MLHAFKNGLYPKDTTGVKKDILEDLQGKEMKQILLDG